MYSDTHVYSKEYTPTQNFWANVFEIWPEKEKDIDPNDMQQLYSALSILTEREVAAIRMRCGLGYDPMTYRQIGEHFGVTQERMRQILMHAFRKLRHPKRSGDKIRFLFATRNELKAQIASQQERIQLLEQWLNDTNLKLSLAIKALSLDAIKDNPEITQDNICPEVITVEELDFSIRTYNCLKRSGKNTLADLMKLRNQDLKRIRNLGNKGDMEVEQKLAHYGLSLLPDDE